MFKIIYDIVMMDTDWKPPRDFCPWNPKDYRITTVSIKGGRIDPKISILTILRAPLEDRSESQLDQYKKIGLSFAFFMLCSHIYISLTS